MADTSLSPEEIKKVIENQNTKNNILETNPRDKIKVVKPKNVYLDTLRQDPKSFGFTLALDIYNKERKKKGEEPILKEDLGPNETTAGKEFQAAVVGGTGRILKGAGEIITSGLDLALDTNFTKALDDVTEKFLTDHGSPKTLTGDIGRIAIQYGIPSTATLKLVNNIPRLGAYLTGTAKGYKKFRASLSNIKNKFLRRSAKLGTSIARRGGQAGLALGAADALVAERERPTLFYDKVNEEGKTGRDLAAARLINKLRFGAEGGTIGLGFNLVGKALPIGAKYGLYKPGTYAIGIGAKVLNKPISGATALVARVPGITIPFKVANKIGQEIVPALGTKIVLPVFGAPLKTTWTAKLPEFSKWRTFSVQSAKPLEAALKRFDNVIANLRSLGRETGTQYSLNTAARQEIKRSARRTEKLLESIEKRSYKLAKSFEGKYNTAKTSPASMDYYLDGVLEYLRGQRNLNSLPKDLRITSQALNKDLTQIKKTFGELLPAGDLKEAVLGNLKGYMRKSFSIFENPGYAVKETDPLFKKAQQYALNLINGKGGGQFRVEAKKVFQGPGVSQGQARELQAQSMIRQVLHLGKQDMFDPLQNLNKIGQSLKVKDFIATGEELPTVIKNLLGQQKSLKSSVLTTTSSMVTQSTNKMLFDRLATELQKTGILFKTEEAAKRAGISNPVVVSGARGLGEMKTLLQSVKQPLYGAGDIVEALTSTKGPLDAWLQSGVYKNLLQLKTGVQYGKTVLSPETQVRNFYSAAMFPMARGVIGGRASVTEAMAMVGDDIFRAGKGNAQAELRLLDNINEGIKYGVLDENIVASELAAVLREVRNGKIASVEGLAKFLEKNPFTEKAARLYAGGDNVWKWYTYNWYKSFTKDLFKNDLGKARQWFKEIAGRDLLTKTLSGEKVNIDEAIRQAASWYTRNTIPTYSKVPIAIQALRRTPFGNFVSFPAEMLRTTFNNLAISMKEVASSDPQLRAMGLRGLLGLYTTLGAASYAVKGLYNSFTGVSEDMMDLYKQYFAAPYMKNSNLVALSKPEKGNFKVVNLSDFIPQSVVVEPIEALFAKIREGKSLGNVSAIEVMFGENGPVRSFFESYVSTPIGFEPFIDVARGRTGTGKTIWSESDKQEEIWEKSWKHIMRTLEPGIITSSRKFADSIMKQPTPSGVVRETGDVLIGASTGLKPFNASILESLDYKISEFSRIRTDVFKGEKFYKFDDIYSRGGDVLMNEFIDIQREAFRLQKDIYNSLEAARAWGLSTSDLKKVFKARTGLSSRQIRDIMNGKFTPVNYSKPLFEKKVKTLKKREKELDFDYNLRKSFVYPKSKFNKVIRKLKRDKLDKPFYYDRPVKNDLRGFLDQKPINQGVASIKNTPPPPVPPLPAQPKPVAVASTTPQVNPNTQLTSAEMALLSPNEQAIRLKQRGIA